MEKGRMKKAEMLLDACGSAYQRASNTADLEHGRSLGPTLTDDQIYGLARELWEELRSDARAVARICHGKG